MKHVVITGGSNGIGEALVSAFHEKGYKVIFIDKTAPRMVIPGVEYETIDIRDADRLNGLAQRFSKIDVLINNAAVQHVSLLSSYGQSDMEEMIDVNIKGTLNVTRAFLPHLGDGLIINIGSVHSSVPRTKKIPYDMSKAALVILTKETALELEAQNTRAICVEFGAVRTPMNDDFKDEQAAKEAVGKQVIKHLMTSGECARMVFELTTDQFKYLNGLVIRYDCGRSVK